MKFNSTLLKGMIRSIELLFYIMSEVFSLEMDPFISKQIDVSRAKNSFSLLNETKSSQLIFLVKCIEKKLF